MLEDVIHIADKLLGTQDELPPHISPEEVARWGVAKCPKCGHWREEGDILDEGCWVCRGQP